MALKSSKELIRATSDNSMAQRRFKEQEDDTISSGDRRVPVVYYLCRNGQLDHPHFMEVSLSSPNGLYLRDVINRLNDLRGKAMASLYSWSSKRTYKNGFVWQDLSQNDFISPVHGQEYILKGSQIPETTSSDTNNNNSIKESNKFPAITRRRNQSWSSIDLTEYKVYKTSESSTESTHKLAAANASTQTDDRRRRKKPVIEEEEESSVNQITELRRDEISPPESDSSPETLETLMKADGRLILRPDDEQETNRTVQSLSSGKMRASAVLMQLISCGAMSFKKCGPTIMNGRTRCDVERGVGDCRLERAEKELKSFGGVKLEEKEYFSGSLIETKKEGVADLKRSSSYNADRSSKMGLVRDKDGEELVVSKCISRKDINNKR